MYVSCNVLLCVYVSAFACTNMLFKYFLPTQNFNEMNRKKEYTHNDNVVQKQYHNHITFIVLKLYCVLGLCYGVKCPMAKRGDGFGI